MIRNVTNRLNDGNFFKFGLYFKDNTPLIESIFNTDEYSQRIKNSLELRPRANEFIKRFVKVLTQKSNFYTTKIGEYNLSSYARKIEKEYYRVYSTQDSFFNKEKETAFKYVFFINDSIVIERNFNVYYFNPVSRFSLELNETFRDILDDIKNMVKKQDEYKQWEEYKNSLKYNITLEKYLEISEQKI